MSAQSKNCTRCGGTKPLEQFPLCRGAHRARCKPCHTQDAIDWQVNNREKSRARAKAYFDRHSNPAHLGPPIPPHILNQRKRAGERANPERTKASKKRWADANKEVGRARVRRRQARRIQACPAWADADLMKDFYALAAIWSETTGEAYEVDHYVPLISDRVCGLHCEANLTILTKRENVQKGNRWWPAMP